MHRTNTKYTRDCPAEVEARGDDGAATTLEDGELPVSALARPVVAVREDMPVEELALLLLERKLTCVPVVGAKDEVIGFVSMTDIVREHVLEGTTGFELNRRHPRTMPRAPEPPESGLSLVDTRGTRVREIMMPFVLTLDQRATIAQTAAVMAARGVHQLLLVSSTGEVKGTVEARDVLRACARKDGVYVADDIDESWRKECETAI